jgi:hypothetical protein
LNFKRNIQLYESELKKGEDIYMEFIDVVRDESGAEKDYGCSEKQVQSTED